MFNDMPMWLQIAAFCAAIAVLVAAFISVKLDRDGTIFIIAITTISLLLCAARMGLGPATIFSLAFAAGFVYKHEE